MAEKQSIYNYKKGFLRIWILLSVIWVVVMSFTFDLLNETFGFVRTTNYCSSDSYYQEKLKLESNKNSLAIERDKLRQVVSELGEDFWCDRGVSTQCAAEYIMRDRGIEFSEKIITKCDACKARNIKNEELQNKQSEWYEITKSLNRFASKCSGIERKKENLLEKYAFTFIAPVVLWFVLLITINLTRRLFLWVRSGFKGE